MSQLKEPIPAHLFIAVMYTDPGKRDETVSLLTALYGPVAYASQPYDFSAISPYYDREMGRPVIKELLVFKELVPRDGIIAIKEQCVALEDASMIAGKRTINIDPGFLTPENLLLATGKNYSHRIYLGRGVFAEITVLFTREGEVKELPWTYRDYAVEPARSWLTQARKQCIINLKQRGLIL